MTGFWDMLEQRPVFKRWDFKMIMSSYMFTASLKPPLSSSKARASCFKAALIRLWGFVITQLVCSGMRNQPYVAVGWAACWLTGALVAAFFAPHETLTLALFGSSHCSLVIESSYLIKSQQIMSLKLDVGRVEHTQTLCCSQPKIHTDNNYLKWEFFFYN